MRATLAGIGQIFFLHHPLSGLAILLLVLWVSPLMAGALLLAVFSATLTARLAGFAAADIEQGLFGFNAGLIGLLISLCYPPGVLMLLGIVAGSIASSLLFEGLRRCWSIPWFTAPFNLLMLPWLYLAQVRPQDIPVEPIPVLSGVSQVIFLADPVVAVGVSLVLLLHSVPMLLWALGGSLAGIIAGVLWGLDPGTLAFGIAGFNAVLVAIALCHHRLTWPWILAGTLLAATAGAGLMRLELPALTLPFILSSWLILLLSSRWRMRQAQA